METLCLGTYALAFLRKSLNSRSKMEAWIHKDLSGDEIDQEIDQSLLNASESICIYRHSGMEKKTIPYLWDHSPLIISKFIKFYEFRFVYGIYRYSS